MTDWLVDTSALVRLGTSPDADEWAGRIERGLLRISTVTRLEVGFSARSGIDLRAARRRPLVEEVERGPEVTVAAHSLPLVEADGDEGSLRSRIGSAASGDVPSRTSADVSTSQPVTPRPGASARCRRGRRGR